MPLENVTSETWYLYVVGLMHPDGRLELLPTFLTPDSQDSREDPGSPLVAELCDAQKRPLLRFRIPVGTFCAPGTTVSELAVRGKVPFPPATRLIRFCRDDVVIHEIEVSAGAPRLKLTWTPAETVSGRNTISWTATHPDGKALTYFLRYSHTNGQSWQPASFPTASTQHDLDFDQLPGGVRCQVMVVATDGVRTATVESESFVVPVKPCRAMILSPQDGGAFVAGQSVLLQGQGFYLEEGTPETEELLWLSSQDGQLGRGRLVEAQTLSPGLHRIILRVGAGERVGEASVSVSVGGPTDQRWVLSRGDEPPTSPTLR